MGLCKGSTKIIDTTPKDIKGLRGSTIDYLSGKSAPQAGNGGYQNGAGGVQPSPFWAMPGVNAAGVPSGGTTTVGNNAGSPMVEPVSRAGGDFWGSTMPVVTGTPGTGVDRINAQTMFAGANPTVPYAGNAAPVVAGRADMITDPDRSAVRDASVGQFGNDMMSAIMANINGTGPSRNDPDIMRSIMSMMQGPSGGSQGQNVMDLIMRNLSPGGGMGHLGTASVDSLGSATSGFFNNMKDQYSPVFAQSRADALAAAKESMGNLTGSGAGNTLGAAVNRSLGQEQATLAELAKWGIGEENKRQLELAGINTQRDIANLGTNMGALVNTLSANNTRDIAGINAGVNVLDINSRRDATNINAGADMARTGLDASKANQNTDMGFLDLLFKTAATNQGEQGRALGQQGQMDLATTLQNQNLLQQILSQTSAQGVDLSKFNASQGNQMGAQNAQNFLTLLMGMLNQNNNVVQQNPSAFSQIAGAGTQLAGAYFGGKR